MSRYHLIDTTTGNIVREYSRLKPSKPAYRPSWLERLLSTEPGRLGAVALVSLLFGGTLL